MTRLVLGISTLGRWAAIDDLLGDLELQSSAPDLVVVCSQDGSTPPLSASFPLELITSPLGASIGRNAIATSAAGRADFVLFLNDTSRLDPGFIEALRARLGDHDAYAMRMVDALGPRNHLPQGHPELDRRTVWAAMEPSTALRLDAVLDAGGFDPTLGPGAASPWQCGEIADLLLRMDERLAGFSIEWMPELEVHAQLEFGHLTLQERRRKLRAYGRGSGHIYHRWRYSPWAKLRHVAGGALLFARKPGYSIADSALMALGRFEGVTGRTLGRSRDFRSVVR